MLSDLFEIAGNCDISQSIIHTNEIVYVAYPLFGPSANLQFKLNIPIDEIHKFCKLIYDDIQFEIKEKKMETEISKKELIEFNNSLIKLNEKYFIMLDLCKVLKKIIELLKKSNLSEKEKEFMQDMEKIGNLYKPGTPERTILNNTFIKDS